MATKWVRTTNGLDANDGNSHANAYKTMQKALDNTSGGDRINVAAESSEVLAAALDWVSFGGGTGRAAPLMIAGYTATEGDGGIGEIDGNDAVANLYSTTSIPSYVIHYNMKLHSTTGFVVDPTTGWAFINCEVTDCDGLSLIDGSINVVVMGCHLHTTGGTGVDGLTVGTDTVCIGNEIHATTGAGINRNNLSSVLIGNLIYDVDEHGIELGNSDHGCVIGNHIVGESISNMDGISMTGTANGNIILGNIIKDWGTSSVGGGINYGANGNAYAVGWNHFHNNSEGNYLAADDWADLTANDTTTDPTFANKAAGDFAVGTNAKGKGWPDAFPRGTTTPFVDSGAVQREEAGGGTTSILGGGNLEGGFA